MECIGDNQCKHNVTNADIGSDTHVVAHAIELLKELLELHSHDETDPCFTLYNSLKRFSHLLSELAYEREALTMALGNARAECEAQHIELSGLRARLELLEGAHAALQRHADGLQERLDQVSNSMDAAFGSDAARDVMGNGYVQELPL